MEIYKIIKISLCDNFYRLKKFYLAWVTLNCLNDDNNNNAG